MNTTIYALSVHFTDLRPLAPLADLFKTFSIRRSGKKLEQIHYISYNKSNARPSTRKKNREARFIANRSQSKLHSPANEPKRATFRLNTTLVLIRSIIFLGLYLSPHTVWIMDLKSAIQSATQFLSEFFVCPSSHRPSSWISIPNPRMR